MMKKSLLLKSVGMLALLWASLPFQAEAQSVTAVWSLGNADDLSAVSVSGAETYTSQITTAFTMGSGLTATGLMTSSNADTDCTAVTYDPAFMKFRPAAQTSSKTAANALTYTVTPAAGHTFKPTGLSFDVAKVGTDAGNVDVYLTQGSGSAQVFKAVLSPLRNKITATNTTGYSSFSYPLSDILLTGEPFTVTLYFYNITATKDMAFRNLTLTGQVDEPIYDFSHYVTGLTCSVGDLYDLVSASGNGETVSYPTKLSAAPTEFTVVAAEGYEATVTYADKVATITVTAGGEVVYTAAIRFVISSRVHGTPVALNRGLLPIVSGNGVFVSWRKRAADAHNTTYRLYRDGVEVSGSPFSSVTNTLDGSGSSASHYSLEVVRDNTIVERQDNVAVWNTFYKHIPTQTPLDKRGLGCVYTPNDCSAYDMDGDGEYEIIVKWDPDNSKDSASSGTTGSVYLDCYKLDGTLLWRIDLGRNIRAGAHYTQFLCYDFDGDGFGELVCKTAPGTVDGEGNYVLMGNDDPTASYINSKGHIDAGPEYLTIFDGVTGGEIHTVAYHPAYGEVSTSVWGDTNCNRSDRYKACVAFLDGVHPSAVMMRGYYSGSFAAAYDFDGETLTQRWYHKSDVKNQGTWGEGAHSVTVGDVDGDGCDEIVCGAACIDHDGTTLYRTGYGHGDALHLGDFDLDNEGMEVFMVHESTAGTVPDAELRDAKTGKVLVFMPQTGGDTGRGLIGDFDSKHEGSEFFHSSSDKLYDCKGAVICPWQQGTVSSSSVNYRIYWTGDLYDEYHDRAHIDKWDSEYQSYGRTLTLYNYGASTINSTKNNPNLQADLFGDWREEIIYWDSSNNDLIIYSTTTPSDFGLPTLRDDHVYDMAIAWQNVGYNQPPHLSYSPVDYFTVKKTPEADCVWAPFYCDYKVDLPSDVEAYCVSGYSKNSVGDTVTLRRIEADYIPAGKPVLLKVPTGGKTYRMKPSDNSTAVSFPINYLRGVMYADTITSAPEETVKGEFFYAFRKDASLGYGFYLIDSQELPDNTSYLRVKETSTFKHAPYYLLGTQYNGGTSAIEQIRTDVSNDAIIYDMTGRRVETPTRGFYIVGGKKVFLH